MKRTLYIFSNGELKRKGNTIYFESNEGKKYIPVENIQEIFAFGEVTMNKKLFEFLCESEIILHFFNYYGYYVGSYYPREHLNSGFMILKQAEHYLDESKRVSLAKKFVIGAVENINRVLAYYKNRGKDLNEVIEKIDSLSQHINRCTTTEELMAIEGNIREKYYKAFDKILDNEHFVFQARSKRPPLNRINALISFGNSLLYTVCLSEIYNTHLDPRIGFLHTTNFRRFTLNLDVSEVFKPIIVDRVIFNLVNKSMIKPQHFESKLQGIVLNEKGREIFIREFDERLRTSFHHRGLKRNVTYKTLIRLELYKIEKHLMGDEEYKPFISSW
ncbi:MAG: type I-B CRISPR-associated endonuclease Cas1 [Candidatus Hydrothermae bacterium]|nr:type I-B CRISPR-associated endonuclease Cas1 [Candidatus Hydrothermae bacterium]MDD3649826.1 type I-B CRISPR-associated endonuclease Cas1b [Candidatus Hydrothermia bacterium]HOQ17346.1 type I-B CRISPR-associated endonuclease Cas1b [Defluviitaleaceae bacterium]MDD5573184.1 type I-B CRISPR-associated endonuclease Cas1b [Candidatus Hydrothermia bacterium]HOK23772.1 type I-B CRISPR-associated endonuclease Cas1b [Candidatus Hydrothermia bacterium]